MSVFSLTYMSSAFGLYDWDVYRQIAISSHVYNKKNAITGTLLIFNDSITQFLEGPEKEVRRLFSRIKKDKRHKNVMVISERFLEKREFPVWTMGYQEIVGKDDPKYIFKLNRENFELYIPSQISGTTKSILNSFSRASGLAA